MSIIAQSIMRTDLVTVRATQTVADAARVLAHHRVSGAPVLGDDGELVGVLSITDVARRLAEVSRPVAWRSDFYIAPRWADPLPEVDAAALDRVEVREIMTPRVIDVPPNAPLDYLAKRMVEERVHRVLVTVGRRLVGLVSSTDILRLVSEGRVVPAPAAPRMAP